MFKEISDSDIETTYVYSDVGMLCKKSYDIYNYYYENNGHCDKIDISWKTIVDYDYKISDSDVLGLPWMGFLFTNFAGYIYGMDTIRDSYVSIYKVFNNQYSGKSCIRF